MNIRPARRIQFSKLGVIIISWLLVGLVITVYDHLSLQARISAGPTDFYSFRASLTFNLSAALIGSLLGGSFLVFYVNERLKDKPYGKTLLAVGLSFAAIMSITTVILGFLFIKYHNGAFPYTDQESTRLFNAYLFNPLHAKNLVVWSAITLLTQFTLQMDDKFGRGMLWNFIKGKYQTPQREERIFMFMDIKGSTSIAEALGNDDYYRFLKDFFIDITKSITDNSGRIYQYVGDEVVISWTMKSGLWRQQCIRCFFHAQERIEALAPKYVKKFGYVPRFKAGLHYGKVTAGEIGVIKRDITYSGDVLNTTARIIGQCNALDESLLISKDLMERLTAVGSKFEFNTVGAIELRGKSEEKILFGVKPLK